MSDWSHLVGKCFKRSGGKYPGFWIVIGLTPGNGCICLGIDWEGEIVGCSNYQPYYVDGKESLAQIDITGIRIETGDGRSQTSDLSPILAIALAYDGEGIGSEETLVS